MADYRKLCFGAAIVMLAAAPTSAQTKPAGDKDDQFVISGCVVNAKDVRATGPQSLMVWSKGDVYLASPNVGVKPSETANPVGTTGTRGTLFYWLEDENDFAPYIGQRVEITGELSDEIDHGQIELKREGDLVEVDFDAGHREAEAKIPVSWFGPTVANKDDFEADIAFRKVDVEKVTPMGPCTAR